MILSLATASVNSACGNITADVLNGMDGTAVPKKEGKHETDRRFIRISVGLFY